MNTQLVAALCLSFACGVGHAADAHAQTGDDAQLPAADAGRADAPAAATRAGAPHAAPARQASAVRSPDEVIAARWSALIRRDPGSEDERAAFGELLSARTEAGYRELPAHAAILMHMAIEQRESGNDRLATRYREWSERLAPSAALPHLFDARTVVSERPWALLALRGALQRTYASLASSPAGSIAATLQWQSLAFGVLRALSLVLASLLFLRHASAIAHDLRIVARRRISAGQALVVVGLAAVTPALLSGSVVVLVVSLFAIAAAHLHVGERLGAVLLLAATLAAGTLADSSARALAAPLPSAHHLTSAVESPCDASCQRVVRALEGAGDAEAALAVAWMDYRASAPAEQPEISARVEGMRLEGSARASADLLRGNISYLSGDYEEAERLYVRSHAAGATRAQRGAALFNLHRVHAALGNSEAADAALAGADQEDPLMVAALAAYRGRPALASLAVSPLPLEAVVPEPSPRELDVASQEAYRRWGGPVPRRLLESATVAVIALLFAGGIARRRRWVAERCTECAAPVSRFVSPDAYRRGLCVLCHQLAHERRALSNEQIEARQARVDLWRALSPQLRLAGDLVLPGAGSVAAGRFIVGAVLAAAAVVAWTLLVVTPLGVLPYGRDEDVGQDARVPITLALFALGYGAVALGEWRRRRRAAASKDRR